MARGKWVELDRLVGAMHISSSSSEKRSTTSPMATGCLFSSADANRWPLSLGAPEAGSTEPSILSLAPLWRSSRHFLPSGLRKKKREMGGEKRGTLGKKGPTGCEIDSESQNGQTHNTKLLRDGPRPPVPPDCFNQPPKKKKKRGERRGGAWRPKHKCGTTKKMMKQTSSKKRPFS